MRTGFLTAIAVSAPLLIVACGGDAGPTQPAAPTKLVFTVHPTNAAGAQLITPPVQITVQDASGNTVTNATTTVTVALGANPGAATLSGTLTVAAIQGIVTFSNLRIDRPGSGYTLVASAGGLSGATSTPFAVTLTFAAVSASSEHTCGVAGAGAAYCWGDNSSGRLGDGTTTDRSSPVLVAGGVSFATVSAGGGRTCGVTAAGAAYCWGYNQDGEVGDGGTISPRLGPVLVAGGVTFTAVSAGFNHTCGVTAAGAAYCWGENFLGQLGDGTTTNRSSPVLVAGGVSFAAVSAGSIHTCGVTAAGAAYCWGNNSEGQLGDGTTTSRASPVLVAGGVSFAAVSAAGTEHTCGVTAAGAAYCWGERSMLGGGNMTTTNALTPGLVVGGVSFAAVSAGSFHTCGVTVEGAAYCWGSGGEGELGDGSATPLVQETPGLVVGGVSFAAVSPGDRYTCGVTAAGAAYCWGWNLYGQLGDGTTINRLTPVRVVQ